MLGFARRCEMRRAAGASQRLIVLLLLGTLCTGSTFARPQAGGAPAIRIESNEVLVPAMARRTQTVASARPISRPGALAPMTESGEARSGSDFRNGLGKEKLR
jgi:hypothetical protein